MIEDRKPGEEVCMPVFIVVGSDATGATAARSIDPRESCVYDFVIDELGDLLDMLKGACCRFSVNDSDVEFFYFVRDLNNCRFEERRNVYKQTWQKDKWMRFRDKSHQYKPVYKR